MSARRRTLPLHLRRPRFHPAARDVEVHMVSVRSVRIRRQHMLKDPEREGVAHDLAQQHSAARRALGRLATRRFTECRCPILFDAEHRSVAQRKRLDVGGQPVRVLARLIATAWQVRMGAVEVVDMHFHHVDIDERARQLVERKEQAAI